MDFTLSCAKHWWTAVGQQTKVEDRGKRVPQGSVKAKEKGRGTQDTRHWGF